MRVAFIRGRRETVYIRKTWKAGRTVEVKKTYSARYGRKIPRGENVGTTGKAQESVNYRNAIAELRRTLNANFQPGDWHAVFTYPNDKPPTATQAYRDKGVFMRRLRKLYRDMGMELKYVHICEYQHKRIHHHMVIPNLPEGMAPVKRLWKELLAETYYTEEERERGEPLHLRFPWSPLDDSGQYGELAEYLIKETNKSRNDPTAICKRRYSQSRNLIHPKPVVEIIDAKQWRKEAAQRKGFYIDKNASFEGISEENGLPVQETIYVAISRVVRKRC